MTDTRTDRESVERLAKTADLFAKAMKAWQHKTQKHNEDVRDTLLALLAERDALQAKLDEAEANINLKADFIEATLNDCAALTQKLDEAQAGRVKVRALVWCRDEPGGTGQWGNGLFNYIIRQNPDTGNWRWCLNKGGTRTWVYGDDEHETYDEASVKAAAQSDYERLVSPYITTAPITPAEAAEVLLEAWQPANINQALYPDSVPFRQYLRAIAAQSREDAE